MVIEGMLALTGQHFIIDYNEREGTLPGFVEGFSNVARDEHRHIAFGVRFLIDRSSEDGRNRDVIQRMLEEAIPVADKVIDPPWADEDDLELFGVSREETHAFAAQCLSRRLKAIGLVPAAALAPRPASASSWRGALRRLLRRAASTRASWPRAS